MRINSCICIIYLFLSACGEPEKPTVVKAVDTVKSTSGETTVILAPTDGTPDMNHINTGRTTPQQLINFAQTAIGVPYKYASSDPKEGFDCSGFITYTFNHFGIAVPRTSVDFTDVEHEVPLEEALPGDLILFTGTDSTDRTVGHMGIVITNPDDSLEFIHSTSGKAKGVTISPLQPAYITRFVKVIRVFPQNENTR